MNVAAALTVEDQQELNEEKIQEASEEYSTFNLSKSNSVTPLNPNSVNNLTEYKQPKLPCRRSARLSSQKDNYNYIVRNFLPPPYEPDYCPPHDLKKSNIKKSTSKKDVIVSKTRTSRRNKRIGSCEFCDGNQDIPSSMSYKKAHPILHTGMNVEPLSTEQLREILEGDETEELLDSSKILDKNSNSVTQSQDVVKHQDSEDINENRKPKMTRARSSLKLKIKKVKVETKSESNDVVAAKDDDVQKSKPPAKKRKRQNCRKQFRHKDITLYKLGADAGPLNESVQKSQAIHKIFLRRKSVAAPSSPVMPPKSSKKEEITSEDLSDNDNNKCSEDFEVVKDTTSATENNPSSSSSDSSSAKQNITILNNSICSIESDMLINKIPKVVLTPINTTQGNSINIVAIKDKDETDQKQIQTGRPPEIVTTTNIPSVTTNTLTTTHRNEVGKHFLPMRIPERRSSIAEPLRTPPIVLSKPSPIRFPERRSSIAEPLTTPPVISKSVQVHNENQSTQSSNQSVVNSGLPNNCEVTRADLSANQDCQPLDTEKSELDLEKSPTSVKSNPLVNFTEKTTQMLREIRRNKETTSAEGGKATKKSISLKTIDCETAEPVSAPQSLLQSNPKADPSLQPQNLSVKIVKNFSGITDPLKHKSVIPQTKTHEDNVKVKEDTDTLLPEHKSQQIVNSSAIQPSVLSNDLNTNQNTKEIFFSNSPILQKNLLNGSGKTYNDYTNNRERNSALLVNNKVQEMPQVVRFESNSDKQDFSTSIPNFYPDMPVVDDGRFHDVLNRPVSSVSAPEVDFPKKSKREKRKTSRSNSSEGLPFKSQRDTNYENYNNLNYVLPRYPNIAPNHPYNTTHPIPSSFGMYLQLYQTATNTNSSIHHFNPSNMGNSPVSPIMDKIIAPQAHLFPHVPLQLTNPPSTTVSDELTRRQFDEYVRMYHNHQLMYGKRNIAPTDYEHNKFNIDKRNEKPTQTISNPLATRHEVGFPMRTSTRHGSISKSFPVSENSLNVSKPETQSTPLALVKTAATSQYNNRDKVVFTNNKEELTITKLPLYEKPQNPKELSNFKQFQTVPFSTTNVNISDNADLLIYPSNQHGSRDRTMGNVLHSGTADVSISLVKSKNNEKQGKEELNYPDVVLIPNERPTVPATRRSSTVSNIDYVNIQLANQERKASNNISPFEQIRVPTDKSRLSSKLNNLQMPFVNIVDNNSRMNNLRSAEGRDVAAIMKEPTLEQTETNTQITNKMINSNQNKVDNKKKILENNRQANLDKHMIESQLSCLPLEQEIVHQPLNSIDRPSNDIVQNKVEANSINAIASVIQDIVHQGDVSKFDQYVEALRRSFANQAMKQFNASNATPQNTANITKASTQENETKLLCKKNSDQKDPVSQMPSIAEKSNTTATVTSSSYVTIDLSDDQETTTETSDPSLVKTVEGPSSILKKSAKPQNSQKVSCKSEDTMVVIDLTRTNDPLGKVLLLKKPQKSVTNVGTKSRANKTQSSEKTDRIDLENENAQKPKDFVSLTTAEVSQPTAIISEPNTTTKTVPDPRQNLSDVSSLLGTNNNMKLDSNCELRASNNSITQDVTSKEQKEIFKESESLQIRSVTTSVNAVAELTEKSQLTSDATQSDKPTIDSDTTLLSSTSTNPQTSPDTTSNVSKPMNYSIEELKKPFVHKKTAIGMLNVKKEIHNKSDELNVSRSSILSSNVDPQSAFENRGNSEQLNRHHYADPQILDEPLNFSIRASEKLQKISQQTESTDVPQNSTITKEDTSTLVNSVITFNKTNLNETNTLSSTQSAFSNPNDTMVNSSEENKLLKTCDCLHINKNHLPSCTHYHQRVNQDPEKNNLVNDSASLVKSILIASNEQNDKVELPQEPTVLNKKELVNHMDNISLASNNRNDIMVLPRKLPLLNIKESVNPRNNTSSDNNNRSDIIESSQNLPLPNKKESACPMNSNSFDSNNRSDSNVSPSKQKLADSKNTTFDNHNKNSRIESLQKLPLSNPVVSHAANTSFLSNNSEHVDVLKVKKEITLQSKNNSVMSKEPSTAQETTTVVPTSQQSPNTTSVIHGIRNIKTFVENRPQNKPSIVKTPQNSPNRVSGLNYQEAVNQTIETSLKESSENNTSIQLPILPTQHSRLFIKNLNEEFGAPTPQSAHGIHTVTSTYANQITNTTESKPPNIEIFKPHLLSQQVEKSTSNNNCPDRIPTYITTPTKRRLSLHENSNPSPQKHPYLTQPTPSPPKLQCLSSRETATLPIASPPRYPASRESSLLPAPAPPKFQYTILPTPPSKHPHLSNRETATLPTPSPPRYSHLPSREAIALPTPSPPKYPLLSSRQVTTLPTASPPRYPYLSNRDVTTLPTPSPPKHSPTFASKYSLLPGSDATTLPAPSPPKFPHPLSKEVTSLQTASSAIPPRVPLQEQAPPFRLYPPYPLTRNENSTINSFRQVQANLRYQAASSSSIATSNHQQALASTLMNESLPPNRLHRLYPKSSHSSEVIDMKSPEFGRKDAPTLRQPVIFSSEQANQSEQPKVPGNTMQVNFCEVQLPTNSLNKSVFTEPRKKCVIDNKSHQPQIGQSTEVNFLINPLKKAIKEDHKGASRKSVDTSPFTGNVSPDYGYYSPLTKNAPPNFEHTIYHPSATYKDPSPNPPLETAKFNTSTKVLPPRRHSIARDTIQHNSNMLSPPTTDNNRYIGMHNGVHSNVSNEEEDNINNILQKLHPSETLNPEQYVAEMTMLETSGVPKPFLEFYSYLTKKQIANNQSPISFCIFLEFHNAGKLKSCQNAFRVYSEKHEKERKMMQQGNQ